MTSLPLLDFMGSYVSWRKASQLNRYLAFYSPDRGYSVTNKWMPTKVNNAWQTSPQDRQHRALSPLLGEAMARYFITNVMLSDLMFMFFSLIFEWSSFCKLALKVFPSDDENFPATKKLPAMGFYPTDYYMGVLKVVHLHVSPRWLSNWAVVNKLSCWIKSQWRKLFILLLTLSSL